MGRRLFFFRSHSEVRVIHGHSVIWVLGICISIPLYHHSRHSRPKNYGNTTPKTWQRSVLDPRNHQSDVSQLQFHQGYDTYNLSIIIINYICSSCFFNHFMIFYDQRMINDLVFPLVDLKLEENPTRTCLSGRGLDHLPTAGGWWCFSFS